MKIKEGFIVREILDEWIVLPVGESANVDHQMMVLSESGAFIWNELTRETDEGKLYQAVLSRYLDGSAEIVSRDLLAFLGRLKELRLLEEEK